MIHGYSTLAKVAIHLFELPVSIYQTKDSKTLDFFVLVPLYEVALKLTIGKKESDTVPDSLLCYPRRTRTMLRIHLILADTNEKVTNDTEKSTSSFLKRNLDDCIQLDDDYHCKRMIHRQFTIFDSCEMSVFHQATQKIRSFFQIRLLNIVEAAIPVTTVKPCCLPNNNNWTFPASFPRRRCLRRPSTL